MVQSLVRSHSMRCYLQIAVLAVLLALSLVTAEKSSKNDYLQPYKFVKPLADLDLFMKAKEPADNEDAVEEEDEDEAEGDDTKTETDSDSPDVLQSRSGEAHPLMSDDLLPPKPAEDPNPQVPPMPIES